MPNPPGVRAAAALLVLLALCSWAPAVVALEASTKAIRVVGSSEYPDSVQSYSAEVTGFSGEFDGSGIGVAILDTGVDDGHATFEGAWTAGAEWMALCPGTTGGCFREQDPTTGAAWNPDDMNGHGTHVASIALGRGGPGVGPRGVAAGARLVDVKIATDAGGLSIDGVARGIDWVIEYNEGETSYGPPLYPVKVISISFASLSPVREQDRDGAMQAVQRAWARGILVVAAAGNCGPGDDSEPFGGADVSCDPLVDRDLGNTITSPGAAPEALTVGAVDDQNTDDRESISRNDDLIATYSSRGPNPATSAGDEVWRKPDVVAPGSRIAGACASTTPNDQHGDGLDCEMSGTSMATPHVSGLAAILFQAGEFARPDSGYSAREVKDLITATAQDWGAEGWDSASGYGYVDAFAMIVAAVNRVPDARFTFRPQDPLVNIEVTFDASLTADPDPQDTIATFLWDFGDGSPVVEIPGETNAVQHTFRRPGVFTVSLTAVDARGATDVITESVEVRPPPARPIGSPPDAALTWWPKKPLAGEPVHFDASNTSDPDKDTLVKYQFDFDNEHGEFEAELGGSDPKAIWTFNEAGLRRVALRVVDERGLSTVKAFIVTILPPPPGAPAVEFSNPKEGDLVQAGALLAAWVVTSDDPAKSFTIYLDGVHEGTLATRQIRLDVVPGEHTLKLVALGPGGQSRSWVNFTALGDGIPGTGDASCSSHTHGDGTTEQHCTQETGSTGPTGDDADAPDGPSGDETGGTGETTNDSPVPAFLLPVLLLVAALAARRRRL